MSEEISSTILSLSSQIEALLFVSSGPVEPSHLAASLDLGTSDILEALQQLEMDLSDRGLRLQEHLGLYQLTTAPALAPHIETFLGLELTTRLSRPALESLAIIAYKQPITRPAIEYIRGVNSDGVIRNLLSKGLITEVGRADTPGRPVLFATTPDFLQQFGLTSLQDLPPVVEADLAPATAPADGVDGEQTEDTI